MKRLFFAAGLLFLAASAPARQPHGTKANTASLPIIFVHGNGDDAARWIPTIWLFESNGYPKSRLFAIRFTNPVARTDDTREEPHRSSSSAAMAELRSFVEDVSKQTHAPKVILVGSSRGGLTIRNYVQNGGGAATVEADILCGTPNHGVVASALNPGGEFNGSGAFLQALNRASAQGDETTPGVRTLTLRSDKLDKYAQPTGITSGKPDTSTGVTFEGPALKGATNIVLPGKDHRELAFSREAFAEMYRFITGLAPKTTDVIIEDHPMLSGLITGFAGPAPTNLGLASVHLSIAEINAGKPDRVVYETTIGESGAWGPFRANPHQEYAFDLQAEGRHVVYFLAPLPRSTSLLNLRFTPAPASSAGDSLGNSRVLITRPEGYFSQQRDPVLIDGVVSKNEPTGLPIRDSFAIDMAATSPEVTVQLRQEKILVHPLPKLQQSLAVAVFLW